MLVHGSTTRDVHVWAADVHLNADSLRKLAAAALDAADELDNLQEAQR